MGLLDSGASKSLIKSNLVGEIEDITVQEGSIKGLGGREIPVLSRKKMTVSIAGMEFPLNGMVVSSRDIKYDVILGVDFLKDNKFSVNLKLRTIKIDRPDHSVIKLVLDEQNEISQCIFERIPVFSTNFTNVESKGLVKVPVNIDIPKISRENREYESILYFEGDNSPIESLNGIMNCEDQNHVLVDMKKGTKLRSNQLLGHVYSMVNIEDNESRDDIDEWNKEQIASSIVLTENLSEQEKEIVRKMLLNVREALSKGDDDIGLAVVEPHRIELTRNTPIWQKARNFSQPVNEEIQRQCDELLSVDIIELSKSAFSSPVVPVRKGDGTLRLCVDYRQLNKITIKENFPMPNLTKCIYQPRKVNYFTKIDLVRGYYQVPIEEESRKYTAFSTLQQQYQFKRLSFGLKNSGMAFQRVMQQILNPVRNHNILIYIDDILVMSETFDEHLDLVRKVLQLLRKHGIKIKVNKCEFFRCEVNFLGHVISHKGIRKSSEYVDKVMQVEKPQTVKEMRKFLGLVNFQRKFVPYCSILTKPLSEWTTGSRSKKVEWNARMEEAFNKLKEEIAKDVLLAYPDYEATANKLELYVDASSTGCGSSLMQKQNDEYKVIAYGSMTFSETQKRYSTTDRELTAIRWGVNDFRCFLAGVSFVLHTDHRPLIHLNSMAITNSRLMRTLTELGEYDFEIKYRPGEKNEAADFLSRLGTPKEPAAMEYFDHKFLPKELKKICEVAGGGNSLFESLLIALKESKENEEYAGDQPDDCQKLREELVSELIKNITSYRLENNKTMRQRLKLMLYPGQQPIDEVLVAASKIYEIRALVYCGMKKPIIFDYNEEPKTPVRIQCVSMIHYNPWYVRKAIDATVLT